MRSWIQRPYNCTTRLLPALAFQKPSQNLQANPPALRTPCSLGTYSQGLIELRTRPHSIFPQKTVQLAVSKILFFGIWGHDAAQVLQCEGGMFALGLQA